MVTSSALLAFLALFPLAIKGQTTDAIETTETTGAPDTTDTTDTDELVADDRIKVFLYAAPAFWQEVAVDAKKDTCTDLDNNLIDGMVQSILIGGRDVPGVLQRSDNWYCTFYDNYDCTEGTREMLTFGDGINNLASVNWTGIHALKCSIENEWYTPESS